MRRKLQSNHYQEEIDLDAPDGPGTSAAAVFIQTVNCSMIKINVTYKAGRLNERTERQQVHQCNNRTAGSEHANSRDVTRDFSVRLLASAFCLLSLAFSVSNFGLKT
jgi:hypothetical protein